MYRRPTKGTLPWAFSRQPYLYLAGIVKLQEFQRKSSVQIFNLFRKTGTSKNSFFKCKQSTYYVSNSELHKWNLVLQTKKQHTASNPGLGHLHTALCPVCQGQHFFTITRTIEKVAHLEKCAKVYFLAIKLCHIRYTCLKSRMFSTDISHSRRLDPVSGSGNNWNQNNLPK